MFPLHTTLPVLLVSYTVCPLRYRTRHFFHNSNTTEDIATKFEQEYVHCVRNEEECVCCAFNCCDTINLLKKCRVRSQWDTLYNSGALDKSRLLKRFMAAK